MTIRFRKPAQTLDTELCETHLNLLAHAQCIELEIGSRCGGHGICGGDRILLPMDQLNSFSAITPEEKRHLTPEELTQGVRLACQCFPEKNDLQVDIQLVK